jgi:hypothetical protein
MAPSLSVMSLFAASPPTDLDVASQRTSERTKT